MSSIRRPSLSRRVACVWAFAAAAVAAGVTTTPATAPASVPTGPRHGCGTIAVTARPWRSTVPGGRRQTGDHWIVWWEGRQGNCVFAKSGATKLVRTITTRQAEQVYFQWQGGRCISQRSRAHETIDPFWKTGCSLPFRLGRATYHPVVYVMVDPDPQYIH